MKTVEEMKTEYKATLDKAKSENRSLSQDESATLDSLKAEIEKMESNRTAQIEKRETELRSIEDGQKTRTARMAGKFEMRSIEKGSNQVGNEDFIADVVRQFEAESPIFAAHSNVQKRSTGNSYAFTRVVPGGAGYVKSEGSPGTEDKATQSGETESSLTTVPVGFKTYSGQQVLITQESLDDYAADVQNEVMQLGMFKATNSFDKDAVDELETVAADDTADTTWDLSDLIVGYMNLPNRNKRGVKYITSPSTAADIIGLMVAEDSAKLSAIGLTVDNLIVDSNCTANTVTICNPTLALAIGMKTPIRIVKLEVSEGVTIECQPRLAVALRDETAVSRLHLKSGN